MVIRIEIALLIATLVLGAIWTLDPSPGNYEPFIVLCGTALAVMEAARRYKIRKKDSQVDSMAEVAELLRELKSIKQKDVSDKQPGEKQAPKPDETSVKLNKYFRQKGEIERGLIEVAKLGGSTTNSPLEAVESISVPDVFRAAMREYLAESEQRIRESYSYLNWALNLGETLEKLIHHRVSTGVWD